MLGTASGEDLGATGKITIRRFPEGQKVEFQAIVATKVKKRLLSCTRLREGGYSLVLHDGGTYVEKDGKKAYLTRVGKRGMANFKINKKVDQANVVTKKVVQREPAKVRKEMRTMRTGLAGHGG